MARYESLVGKRVEAQYRAAEIQLSTVGILVSDSGKSVILEDRFSAGGKDKAMRVEIPYEYLVRIAETKASPAAPAPIPPPPSKKRP
jgi:hypothetical protein